MIYELRTYTCLPRKRAEMAQLMERLMPVFERNGIKIIGLWTTIIGRAENFYYLVQHESLAQREQNWAKLLEDDELKKAVQETDPLTQFQDNVILQPTPYSPLK